VSKKQNTEDYDDSEVGELDDDSESDGLEILGSRFARIASGPESEKLHRAHHDYDGWEEQASRRKSFRPREKLHRDKSS
jgi:hypothetical protein